MKVKLISVQNQGDVDKEYVFLEATEDCDIGRYLLTDTTYTSTGKISNKLRHVFWFPDKEVKKGDLISVWTKQGQNTTTKNDKGTPIHRFYWGLNSAVWNDDGDCAVLMEVSDWSYRKAK